MQKKSVVDGRKKPADTEAGGGGKSKNIRCLGKHGASNMGRGLAPNDNLVEVELEWDIYIYMRRGRYPGVGLDLPLHRLHRAADVLLGVVRLLRPAPRPTGTDSPGNAF